MAETTFPLDQDCLFKYCDRHGIDILQSLRLKVRPPSQFNDPFELLPRIDLCRHETDVKKRYQDFLKNQRELVESLTIALACYSEIQDNLLMWSHYTCGHRGIVVEFDAKNSFFSQARNLMPVSYRPDRVSAKFDEHGFAFNEDELSVERTKSVAWSYEREWRQRFELKDCTEVHNPGKTPSYYIPIPREAIASVIFGERCPTETENRVRELTKRPELRHVRLRRARLHERDFKLNIVDADNE